MTTETRQRNINNIRRLLPIIALAVPLAILYMLYPGSFEGTWKGRTFYLFFMWLIILETILSWKEPKPIKGKLKNLKITALIIALALPTVYIVALNYYGINAAINNLALQTEIPLWGLMWLSTEYLVLTALFALIAVLDYGVTGLSDFSVSTMFLGLIGVIYTIDNFYPYGRFTPFQMIVPTTTQLAANVLNIMGYNTAISYVPNHPSYGSITTLTVWNSSGRAAAAIAWPCSGVESLIIYTITILLFLNRNAIPKYLKLVLFAIGAVVTYFINVARITTIFMIGVANASNGGIGSPAAQQFHNYYGQLYSITWIMMYPLLIIGVQLLSDRIRSSKPRNIPSQSQTPTATT
jgi:thaumarchaeosortase